MVAESMPKQRPGGAKHAFSKFGGRAEKQLRRFPPQPLIPPSAVTFPFRMTFLKPETS